jgi:hypothetical protein
MSFIAGRTNRQISDKPPMEYFPEMIEKSGKAAFASQCIPTADKYLGTGSYKVFLKECRTKIATRLNEYLSP